MTIAEQLHAKQAEMRMRMFAGIGGSFEKAEPVYDENLFEKAECYMDDFLIEKAKRQVGETKEINGKTYVWNEYQPGKYDWKVANKKKGTGEGDGKSQSQPKSLADHAKGTSTDTLKKVANSSNAPQELKDAAKKELASRSEKAEKHPEKKEKNESVVSKIENKLKTLNFDKIRGLLDGYEDVEDMKGIGDDEKKLYEVISEHVTWSDEDKYNADPEAYESKIKKNGGAVFKLKDNTPVEIRDLNGMKAWLKHRNGETDETNDGSADK